MAERKQLTDQLITKSSWSRFIQLSLTALLFSVVGSGCKYVVLAGYLIGGPPSVEPDFDSQTNLSMTAKDVTVAVVCFAPDEVKFAFDSIDSEIAKYVTFRLHEKKIKVVSPDQVRAWLDENDEWMEPSEVGRALGVTYVINIDISRFTLYEENSGSLFRGRTEGIVSVHQMFQDGDGERIYSKEIISKYPLIAPRSTSETTYSTFKRQYLSRLSEDIGRLFYEYYNGDDVPDAT
ncbi:MAG: hypothetical protein CMJ78_15175 [Planctomycetaceae bacterium]|nr:hypothetical protein [Planctomycetaceae bacterium]